MLAAAFDVDVEHVVLLCELILCVDDVEHVDCEEVENKEAIEFMTELVALVMLSVMALSAVGVDVKSPLGGAKPSTSSVEDTTNKEFVGGDDDEMGCDGVGRMVNLGSTSLRPR